MLPSLPIIALLVVSAVVVVHRQLTFRPPVTDPAGDLDSPRFTAAIAAVTLATLLGITAIGDKVIDPAAAKLGLGQNISDLGKSVYLVAACAFFSGQSLNNLQEQIPGDVYYDLRRASLIVCGAIASVLIVLSRLSPAREIPVDDDTVFLTDPIGMAYAVLFWATIFLTAVLVSVAAGFSIAANGIHSHLAAMFTAGSVSMMVAAVVLSRIVLDPEAITSRLSTWGQWWTVPGLAGITIAGMLNVPGHRKLSP